MATKRKGNGPSGKPKQYPVCSICGQQQPFDVRFLPMAGRQVFCGDCKRSNPAVVAAAMADAGSVVRMGKAAA